MKAAAIALASILLVSCAVQTACRPEPPKVDRRVDQIVRPTVQIFVGENWKGSGTVVASQDGRTVVLTAYHVVKERNERGTPLAVRFRFDEEKPTAHAASLLTYDKELDVALLGVNYVTKDVALVLEGEKGPPMFAEVYAAGISGFNFPLCNHGEIVGFKDGRIFVDAHMSFGYSGGGLYAKVGDDWVLVGILVGIGSSGPYPLFHAGVVMDIRVILAKLVKEGPPGK